ncbi:hypothetical protein [Ectopseudomonas oleovorans]|uniref:Uncharacterized protein n=1 Tax=Ectopseudomonas oleovorans TaxID=301 RepID=A0AA42TXG0_ECTOL|nr:hypothetical protein [Pseudomonas oleovorans]MDH1339826.1 hypothetical protein [Pseudomonas oleovorans]MDH1492676.1 hypothetical protein [Pseudomonas oleovorans]WGG21699.1 hypothetical protein N5O83_03085 [Pseudomonas oleovorans]
MSKDQSVLAFIAYHISGGRYGVKNAAGERVGEFIGSKEEAQAEADRLIKAQEEPAEDPIVFGGGDTGLKPLTELQLRAFAADIDIDGHDSLPVDELAGLVLNKIMATTNSTELAAGAGGSGAGDEGAGTTGQEAQSLKLGNLAGVIDQAGNVQELHQLPEEQLRKLAEDMDIEGHAGMTIEQLVAAIQAEDVVVSNPVYVVNRERLDHDGESYGFGDPIEFADPEHARALLLLGAILEDA